MAMRDLRLIGVQEDGQHLLLADSEGERFRVQLDEPLRAAARRDRPRLGQLQIEIDGGMRPREVQALIRGGLSAEEVAGRSGWPVEKVRRYEGPILAEREYVAGLARAVRLRGRSASGASAPTLSARVSQRLSGRGVDPASAEWDAARSIEGDWTVIVTFPAGGRERQARWSFDVQARTVAAFDDEARWLSEEDVSGNTSPLPAPHLVSAPVRATTVYDVEAEGGLGSARRGAPAGSAPSPHDEPLDLMSAMRERASHRGRPRRRKNPATHIPGDDAPRHDALPLEDLAYDPESMPPPPGAKGPHPLDDPDSAVGHDVLPAAPDAQVPVEPEPADELDDGQRDNPDDDTPQDSAPRKAATGASKKPARRSVPSWDDVMFGAKPRD
ncbi:hypothetical protein BJ986_000015 [Phycicoccus badiiscoriae]|uniref:DUF3071 domain-containing protein n=1 Tax=Pedococcus badiiscoriae TaxID=642776 RepID=A0A852W8W8_9MICO|nr:septation protein SepH [Pedococcus badiiscoriae]NYG05528.1 hypothetical protein [Pedococcus badiiscoriae]